MRRRLLEALRTTVARVDRRDVALLLCVAIAASVVSWQLSGEIVPGMYDSDAYDVWFESDVPRVYENMTSRFTYSRSRYHPVFSILVLPPTTILTKAMGLEPLSAIRLLLAGACAVWAGGLFLLLRVVGCRRLDAALFTAVGLSSASVIFFFAVPETFLAGSLAIIAAVLWAAIDEDGERSRVVEAFISAGTLGISTSNWMAGVAMSFYRRRLRDTIQISVNALAIVVLAWTLQKNVIPDSEFFLGVDYGPERVQLFSPEAGGLWRVAVSFFAHTMVMPEIQVVDRTTAPSWWPSLLIQASGAASAGAWGVIALIAWAGLLLLGAIIAVRVKQKPRTRLVLGSVLLGQLGLHLAFGNETFLYAIHWVALFVVVAAYSTLSRWRAAALVAAGVFVVAAGANNLLQFREATTFVAGRVAAVQQRRSVEGQRPRASQAPSRVSECAQRWFDDAAHDRGGGLWPAYGTFNVGFWSYDESGRLRATSDGVEAGKVAVRKVVEPGGRVEISAVGSDYTVRWRCAGPREWSGVLDIVANDDTKVDMIVRGTGWRYSRVFAIEGSPAGLLVNERWRIRTDPAGLPVRMGEEGPAGWVTGDGEARNVESAAGLAFVRIGPLRRGRYALSIVDEQPGRSFDTFRATISYAAGGLKRNESARRTVSPPR